MFHTKLSKSLIAKSSITALSVIAMLALGTMSQAATTITPKAKAAAQARAASIAAAAGKTPRFLPAVTQQMLQTRAASSSRAKAALVSSTNSAARSNASATSSTTSPTSGLSWRSQAERILGPVKQQLIAKAKSAGLNTRLNTHAAASGNLAVNFPGFQSAATAVGGNPNDANVGWVSFSADVNKDGKADVITVQNDGSVNTLLNPGTGSLSSFAVSSSNTAAMQYGVEFVYGTAVDLNNDGYPDLELLDVVNNAVFVYMNKKDGTFNDPVMNAVTFSNGNDFYSYGGSAVFADVNGDKIPDMISTIASPSFSGPSTVISVQVALGNGDGTFAAPLAEQDSTINAYLTTAYGQVVAADINNDGKQDLVYLTGGFDPNFNNIGYVFPVLGNGDGTFAAPAATLPTTGALVEGVFPESLASLAVSDMNGDGNPDFLFNLGDGNLYVALGTGTATPQNVTTAATGLSTGEIGGPSLVNFADVNGDGVADAIAYNYGFIAVYAGTLTGTFSATPLAQLVSGDGGDAQPMPADFNGDGKVDLIQVDYASLEVGFYPGSSFASAGAPAMAATGESAQTMQVLATGDYNGDGYPDVLTADFNGVPVYDPFGGFVKQVANTAGLQQDSTQPNIDIGLNDGKGNFTYTTVIPSAVGMSSSVFFVIPVSADLNGDGKADIIMEVNQGVGVSLSQSDGTYSKPAPVTLSLPTRCEVSAVDVGDLNGDGYPDMVATYPGDGSCGYTYNAVPTPSGYFVMINDKTGNFTSTFVEYGFGVDLPKLADMNGDGKLDLLLADAGSGALGYYFYALPGNGDGTFSLAGATQPLEATVVTSIIPTDFDGDGKMDLALGVLTQVDANGEPVYDTTGVNILKGNGDFTFGLPVQYAPGVYAVDGKAADFNGDGRPDLALNMETFDYYTNVLTTNFAYMPNVGGGSFGPAVQGFGPAAPGNTFAADFNNDGAIDVISSGLDAEVSGVSALYLNLGAISINLSASATIADLNTPITFTATLTAGLNTTSPTGTVTFYDNGAILGIVPVSSTSAVLTVSLTATGANPITAVYSGDSNFNGATSSAVSVTVNAVTAAFSLSAPSPATITVEQGQTGIATLTLAANSAFSGTVSVACSGAPSESSCTISPASATLTASQSAIFSVVIATTAPNNVSQASNNKPANTLPGVLNGAGGVSVAGLALFIGFRRRKRFLMHCGLALLAVAGLVASVGLTGCSNSKKTATYTYQGTPVGTSTITLTATSGSLTQTQTIALTVTGASTTAGTN